MFLKTHDLNKWGQWYTERLVEHRYSYVQRNVDLYVWI